MAHLQIALLGRLHVTLDGQPVTDLRYDKVRALLAYLAIERRPHHRSGLAALFWPDADESSARKNLRNALATLRQALGDTTAQPPFLLVTRDTVQFNPCADMQLDVTAFDALLARYGQCDHPGGELCDICAAQLRQAVELYHGDFLDQVVVPDSLAWEEWLLLIRERLHHQMRDALAQLALHHERRGEDQAARQYARRALALEPWDEAMHRCLMRILAHAGQRCAALAQYERCQQILADELGVEPSAETGALYEHIRAGALERMVGAKTQASVAAQPALPRDWETAGVPSDNRPSHPNVQLLLARLANIGTTRFGLAVTETPDEGAGNVCFIALAPLHDPILTEALAAQASTHTPALAARLQEYLRDTALQLVLDNFERVLANMVERPR